MLSDLSVKHFWEKALQKKINRTKIIPDRIFHKLLDYKCDSQNEYITEILGQNIFKYKNYDLDYMEAAELLKEIYRIQNITFNDIIKECKLKKSELSHLFCIPIRTVEEWFSGKNRCPIYIKIMILRYYHKINLGKYIKLESEINYEKTKPLIYQIKPKISKEEEKEYSPVNDKKEDEEIKTRIYASDDWYSYHLNKTISGRKQETKKLLEDTQYIDELIRKRRNIPPTASDR